MKFSSKDVKFSVSLKDCEGKDGEKGVLVQAGNITLEEYSDIVTAIIAGLAHALRESGIEERDVTMGLFGVLSKALCVGRPQESRIERKIKEN